MRRGGSVRPPRKSPGRLQAKLGAAAALRFRLQARAAEEMPFQFLAILPHLPTAIAPVSIVRRSVQPAALTYPYAKQRH